MPATVAPVARETLVALSREKYARPRVEVEQVIAQQRGEDPLESEDSPEGDAFRRMLAVGVAREGAMRLLEVQPAWLLSNSPSPPSESTPLSE